MNPPRATIKDWLTLIRLPNTFTVIADSTAGFLLANGRSEHLSRYLPMVCGVVLLYWSGMVLNDLFDRAQDQAERPNRPIASGRVSARTAGRVVLLVMFLGIGLSGASGLIPLPGVPTTWAPAVIAAGIALCIYLYDGPLKKTILAPVTMGLCRVGSFLLGASPIAFSESLLAFPAPIWVAACGMGLLIMGITTVGRREANADGDSSWGPLIGVIVVVAGLLLIATIPRTEIPGMRWQLEPTRGFPLLIAAMGLPLLYRGMVAIRHPDPPHLQAFVLNGIMLIIPLAAAIAALAAGPLYGLSVFALMFPAIGLANWFRVT